MIDKHQTIKAKTILSRLKEDKYFGLSYNMNLYRGCQHQCIYCDSRSTCYQIEDFSKIFIKENALSLLNKELSSKRHRGTIGFGSMNDPYMPVEKRNNLTGEALKIVAYHRFPVHIITKSHLVLKDLEVLKDISKVYAAVSFTITSADDEMASVLEPHAPPPSRRFEAIKKLSAENIYTGITMMPVLPFINDTAENARTMVQEAVKAGAKYILPFFGTTLREGSREYFYNELDKSFPGLRREYEETYGNSYTCGSPKAEYLYNLINNLCKDAGIDTRMKFYEPDNGEQLKLF
jgi:DNA repair photolyase